MSSEMHIYSGKVFLCVAGIETGACDMRDKPLHTGDIVVLYLDEGPDQPLQVAAPLTVVVQHEDGDFYTMGIRGSGVTSPMWPVEIAKKYSDVVPGEHWSAYGFSYREARSSSEISLAEGGKDD